MNKTCYFCENEILCHGTYKEECICWALDKFTPNSDWIEYERLVKENEEHKQELTEIYRMMGDKLNENNG